MAIDFPSSPSSGQNYVGQGGKLYIYDGSGWTTKGSAVIPNPFLNSFKYRSIYTRGYVSGGYQNSSPWKNVNRTVHYTDVTVNLGDIMDYAASYIDGSYSDYYQYLYGTSDTWPGVGTNVSSINMQTEAGRTHSASWDLKSSVDTYGDAGVIINGNLTIAWILGTATNIDKHNLVTESMYASGSGGSCGTPTDLVCCWYGEKCGWVKNAGRNHYITFATEVWAAAGITAATDGWGKALKTKDGFAYVKNGGNCFTSAYKINDTTGANIRTDLNFDYSGEENFETGQMWGYCLGHYNGAQNNNSYKVVHATDAYTSMGADTQPKGHGGMSSAATASASASMIGGY